MPSYGTAQARRPSLAGSQVAAGSRPPSQPLASDRGEDGEMGTLQEVGEVEEGDEVALLDGQEEE